MKKFLTVLLVIAVMFTFSFSTAFAAEYTLDDYSSALTAEKTAQLSYLANAKSQVLNGLIFDEDGFTTIGSTKYMKAAVEAAIDAVIAADTAKMDAAINTALNGEFPTSEAPKKTVVSTVCAGEITKAGMEAAMKEVKVSATDSTLVLNKTQAPLTKAFVEGKLNVDLSKYNSKDKKYDMTGAPGGTDLTAVQAIGVLVDAAKATIKDAADETAAAQITAYEGALTTFETAMAKIKTLEDEAFADATGTDSAANSANTWATAVETAIDNAFNAGGTFANMAANAKIDLSALNDFFEAKTTGSNEGTIFGVAVKDKTAVTRTEALAIFNAAKKAVADAKPVVKVHYEEATPASITSDLAGLKAAQNAVEKYAEVKELGEKYKATEVLGVKEYDDANVDVAVKAAEKLVYKDLGVQGAAAYIKAAAAAEKVDIENKNFESQKFEKAIEDAAKKMYSDGTAASTAATKVAYGDNKTPDADLVYLKETYAVGEKGQTAWAKIAEAAVADLEDAQSYDEINSIMAKAAEDFGKLLKAADADAVAGAITAYKAVLEKDGAAKKAALGADADKYPVDAAVDQAKKLLDDATTVDAVKAAYEEGKKIVENVKPTAEVDAARTAVEKQIAALPYTSKLTAADKAAVKAAYDAYAAYKAMPGATTDPTNIASLQEKYDKINELEAKAIDAKAKAINDKIAKVTPATGDADIAAIAALADEAKAVKAEAKALTDEITAANKVMPAGNQLDDQAMTNVGLLLSANEFAEATAHNTYIELVKAAKDDATVDQMKKALDAYNNLTDAQKYAIDENAINLAKVVENKLAALVKQVKITASSKATKGAITVKWTIKGSKSACKGFQIWRSTKKNTGFKKMFTTKKFSYKNTKGLKAGVRYYFKVRAYNRVDGKLVFSDWSNKAYRKAK